MRQQSALLPSKGETGWSTAGRRWSAVVALVGLGLLFAVVRGTGQHSVSANAKPDQRVTGMSDERPILSPTYDQRPLASAIVSTPIPTVPAPMLAPVATAAPRNGVVTHVVRSGETLSHLAVKYEVSVDSIRWASGLTGDLLQIDQKLLIPPVSGLLYTVREGDSVQDIASIHSIQPEAILSANHIDNPDVLPSGTTVVVPGATPTEPPKRVVAVRGGDRSSDGTGSGSTTYEVKPGDTLSDVAAKFGVTVSTVVNANSIPDPNHLTAGQQLIIPSTAGVLHTVQDGDSVSWIAARYGVSLDDIISANKITSPDLIRPGSRILIPSPNAGGAAGAGASQRVASTYTVKPGDTLLAIAYGLGSDAGAIARANGLSEPYFLRDGQILQVPGSGGAGAQRASGGVAVAVATQSAKHVVVSGDTVFGLAVAAKVTPDSIISANGLEPPYILQIGREMIIPGASSDVQVVTAAPANNPAPAPAAQAPTPIPAPATPKPAPPPAPNPEPASLGSRITDLALKYRGFRYTWGGISPSTGFDCSGLVYYVYQQVGRPIPRSLSGQLNSGQRISRSELQPGDIVFFVNTYTSGLSHDGIYVGGGRFINANNENVGVIVNSLSEPYWANRYYGATRP